MEPSEHRKLFVGGLSRETNEDTLREYFRKYGTVEEALVIRYKVTGIGRGFGFVIFADSSMADEALRHNNHVILGRKVDVKQANPKDEYCSNGNANIEFSSKKIFVGGLPSDLTEEEFKSYFSMFGTVTDAVVIYDKESRRPRGFGFITYDSEHVVDDVLKNRYHELKNKKVEVKRAEPKDKNDKNIHYYEPKDGHANYLNYYDYYNTGLGFGGGYSYGYNIFSHYYPTAFQTTVYYHSPCVFVPPNGGWESTITIPRSNLNGSSPSSLHSHALVTSGNHADRNSYVFYTPSFGVCMNGWTSEDVDLTNHNGSHQQMVDSTTSSSSNGDYNSDVVEVPTTAKLPQIDDLSSLKTNVLEHQGVGDLLDSKGNVAEHQRTEITVQEAVPLSTLSEQNGDY